MRKFILFCLALAMVVTSVPAMAASDVDFSGFFRVAHENLYNFNRNNSDTGWRDSDSFFSHRFQLNVNFMPTEDITLYWRLRSIHNQRWGQGGRELFTRYLYAEIRQPWGTLLIGRTADGTGTNVGGLSSLGYEPSWGFLGYAMPFDINGVTDGIVYSYDFGNGFSLGVVYAKDGYTSTYTTLNNTHPSGIIYPDQDADRFGIEGVYKWDTGGFSLGVAYARDTRDPSGNTRWIDFLGHPWQVSQDYTITINPALVQAWDAFSIHFEGALAFSKTVWADDCYNTDPNFGGGCGAGPNPNQESLGIGLGLYLDLDYNYGAGNVTLMAWYAQGNPWDNNSNMRRDIVDMGDFGPFLVAYYANAVGGAAYYQNVLGREDGAEAGVGDQWGLGLLGNHAINDDISMNWGLGYISLAEEPDNGAAKRLGFEIDLGFSFKIIDNLSFDTQLGYMFNGDAFNYGRATTDNPDGTFAWANFLTVSF